MSLLLQNFVLFDQPSSDNWFFQSPASKLMENIIDLHHDILYIIVVITGLIVWFLFIIVYNFNDEKTKVFPNNLTYHKWIEIIWTLIPAVILLIIMVPSFTLLYILDEPRNPVLTLKVLGNQWYWTYEYSNFTFNKEVNTDLEGNVFDSYLISEDVLVNEQIYNLNFSNIFVNLYNLNNFNWEKYFLYTNYGLPRLLVTDKSVILPIKVSIKVLVTSKDVIHSWAIPSLGVKIDATPGRLNQIFMNIDRLGIFYGQCSELCGVNHGFMPIVVKSF